MASTAPLPASRLLTWTALLGLLVLLGLAAFHFLPPRSEAAPRQGQRADEEEKLDPAPELEGGAGWLNTAGPLRLKDLRGKFVLLDFWTYCCINCIHTLPELTKLEQKYANQLVVVGVHSATFDREKDNENIRKAILRYEIAHPVVNDAEMRIWRTYGARAWPTLALIDPEGNYMGSVSGEGHAALIDKILSKYIPVYRKKKVLNEKPIK